MTIDTPRYWFRKFCGNLHKIKGGGGVVSRIRNRMFGEKPMANAHMPKKKIRTEVNLFYASE